MRAFLLFCFTTTFFTLQAQISGRITDGETGAALPYATVSLFSKSDSLLVDGTITDETGAFMIEAQPGSYFAKAEFLAYDALFLENIVVIESNGRYFSVLAASQIIVATARHQERGKRRPRLPRAG